MKRDPWLTETEKKAVRRVEKAVEALPKSIALYFHGPSASVVACDENGNMVEDKIGDGYDRDAELDGINTPRCEAGDW